MTIAYKLYCARCCESTFLKSLEYQYARVSDGHILVYKTGRAPKGFVEVSKEALALLTEAERDWLKEANIHIMQEYVKAHQAEAQRSMMRFAEDLERELAAEAAKLEEVR